MQYRSIYSFMWSVIRPFRWHYAVMLSVPILTSLYDFANNYSLKLVVDAFSETSAVSYRSLLLPIVIFVSAQILLDVIWRIGDIAEWRAEPYVRQAILNDVFSYVQHHPYKFFQSTQSGTITSRIKGILDGYDNFWASMHHDFTPKVANTIVLTLVIGIVNIKVCLLIALWAICFFLIMQRLSLTMGKLSFINANHRHNILGLISDNISNIFTVFSFATRKYELKQLNRLIEKDFIPSNIAVYKFSFLSYSIAGVLYWIMLISLFFFMIHLRQTEQATSGDIVFVMGITLKMCFELWQLVQKMQNVMKNIGDFQSAFSIMQIPHDVADNNGLKQLNIVNPSIQFDSVSFSYNGDKHVFTDLNLYIKPGEKIGLVGVSGAGKSTMVSLLLKYFHPSTGKILIDNQNIALCTADSVRENIAVIPQDILLFHRSIKDNILYGNLTASDEQVIEAARMANIHDFIMSLDASYDSMVGERGVKLSGGQRQRIAIARAFLKNAHILVLDEATSSLDTETEQMIQDSLRRFLIDKNTTVVAIAHRLSTLKHMDRIIVLDRGKIIEEGNHEALIKQNTLYKKLWEMQKI